MKSNQLEALRTHAQEQAIAAFNQDNPVPEVVFVSNVAKWAREQFGERFEGSIDVNKLMAERTARYAWAMARRK